MAVEFAYAQARAQAIQGRRLSHDGWYRVESRASLAGYLHALRGSALETVTTAISESSSPHAIERSLRSEWRQAVLAASRWVPVDWRPAVEWTLWLPILGILSHLQSGGSARPWMLADNSLAEFAAEDAAARRDVFQNQGLDWPEPAENPVSWWIGHWRATWPGGDRDLGRLDRLIDIVFHAPATSGPERRGDTSEPYAARAEKQIIRMLRYSPGQSVTVFCHLGLTAIELMRLRYGLVPRATFRQRREGGSP